MKKFILIPVFMFIIIQFAANVYADFYGYTNEDGIVVLTDNAGNIPENQKSKIETLMKQRDEPSRSHPAMSSRNGQNSMTEEEETERFFADLRKNGVSEEQMQRYQCMVKIKREPQKVWTEQEKRELDSLLRSRWNQMRNALGRGDVDGAVSYFLAESRETYRKMYSSFPKQTLSEMSRELSDIHMVDVDGNRSTKYEILCIREGQTYSFQLLFVKDCDDEWKIRSY